MVVEMAVIVRVVVVVALAAIQLATHAVSSSERFPYEFMAAVGTVMNLSVGIGGAFESPNGLLRADFYIDFIWCGGK
ncbi:MAG: hypothetical protein Aurels2KO_40630 [Aureliella sp.]